LNHREHREHGEINKRIPDNQLSGKVIGAAIEVHRALGPGLLESAYQACLKHEFHLQQIAFEEEKPLSIDYKNHQVDCAYRLDFVIEDCLILELKAVEKVLPIHQAQILTYMKLTGYRLGLLINFNVLALKNGIQRFAI